VFSFIYGIPPRETLEECRAKHIVTIGTATTPEESAALQEIAGAINQWSAASRENQSLT
jgi:hypothetical protein